MIDSLLIQVVHVQRKLGLLAFVLGWFDFLIVPILTIVVLFERAVVLELAHVEPLGY